MRGQLLPVVGSVVVVLASIADPRQGSPVLGLAKAIQLSVAPVFLLTAIAGLLGVISNRLARVLDRAQALRSASDEGLDLALLKRRMTLLTRATEAVTVTGVLVSAVVAVTFVSAIAVLDLAAIVVPLFVAAMLALMVGLLTLLLDARLSARMIRQRF